MSQLILPLKWKVKRQKNAKGKEREKNKWKEQGRNGTFALHMTAPFRSPPPEKCSRFARLFVINWSQLLLVM